MGRQQRLQISDLHFDKFATPATFGLMEDKIQDRGNVRVHNFLQNLPSSTRGISMPNFEVFDARIASALNKIIHNSHFKRRISLEEQKGPEGGPGPGGWGPQGMRSTGGGGLARVPNLHVCYHLLSFGWHMQGSKDELTSCRGTVQSAWQNLQ